MQLTLLRQGSPLSIAAHQVELLERRSNGVPTFDEVLAKLDSELLRSTGLEVLQINIGKRCNQTCTHCHVDAGPGRTEMMSRETLEACLDLLRRTEIRTVDITGGAPEMHEDFRWFVSAVRGINRQVIDRCNLTILVAPGFSDLPQFLASQRVEIIASLPCYLEENTDRQRGDGVFAKSIAALQQLNSLGYGKSKDLVLNLVYNPVGPHLPPDQERLERDYRRELEARFGIVFSKLYTVTNMPISRFLDDLIRAGQYDEYLQTLIQSFNPKTIGGLMCRGMLSVDWRGNLYDCDFNQMLQLSLTEGQASNVRQLNDASLERLVGRTIVTGRHCFGCTAGAGSSCQGKIA